MSNWSLPELFSGLDHDIQQRLRTVRKAFGHPGTKGDASEKVWLDLLQTYLPKRYQVETAHVVDSRGDFSDQIDVVVFDRQYSPLIFKYEGKIIVPAESVYAAFEAKQSINADYVDYAQKKIARVRSLYRTSLPIPFANGIHPPKALNLNPIIGGLLTFESDWSPALGEPMQKALNNNLDAKHLDIGCIAANGYFSFDSKCNSYNLISSETAVTAFLFKLISELQLSGTVPMIDVQAYAKWLPTN
jgi:hypothetical protein